MFLILGVLGNLATCLVIMRNEYMRTTTNIYLFNLAVADLATLLFAMPIELYLMWKQYPWTLGEVLTLHTLCKPSNRIQDPSLPLFHNNFSHFLNLIIDVFLQLLRVCE